MSKNRGGGGRKGRSKGKGSSWVAPTPPKGASAIVRGLYAGKYAQGLSPNREGLTKKDRRVLAAGVRRGDLIYRRDLNLPGRQMFWIPVYH